MEETHGSQITRDGVEDIKDRSHSEKRAHVTGRKAWFESWLLPRMESFCASACSLLSKREPFPLSTLFLAFHAFQLIIDATQAL